MHLADFSVSHTIKQTQHKKFVRKVETCHISILDMIEQTWDKKFIPKVETSHVCLHLLSFIGSTCLQVITL